MSFTLAAFALASQSPIVEAFDSACSGTRSVADVAAKAAAAGWSEEAAETRSPLNEIAGVYRAFGAPAGDRRFSRSLEGRVFYLWVRETIPAPIGQFVECRVYDFNTGEMEPVVEALSTHLRRPPGSRLGPFEDGTAGASWELPAGQSIFAAVEKPICGIVPNCTPRIVIQLDTPKEN
jgi:hypothetical protein